MAIDPNGEFVAIGVDNPSKLRYSHPGVAIFNLATQKFEDVNVSTSFVSYTVSIAVSPQGDCVVACDDNGEVLGIIVRDAAGAWALKQASLPNTWYRSHLGFQSHLGFAGRRC